MKVIRHPHQLQMKTYFLLFAIISKVHLLLAKMPRNGSKQTIHLFIIIIVIIIEIKANKDIVLKGRVKDIETK